jgi:hypothetical protein
MVSPEDGCSMFLRKVIYLQVHTVLTPRRQTSINGFSLSRCLNVNIYPAFRFWFRVEVKSVGWKWNRVIHTPRKCGLSKLKGPRRTDARTESIRSVHCEGNKGPFLGPYLRCSSETAANAYHLHKVKAPKTKTTYLLQ